MNRKKYFVVLVIAISTAFLLTGCWFDWTRLASDESITDEIYKMFDRDEVESIEINEYNDGEEEGKEYVVTLDNGLSFSVFNYLAHDVPDWGKSRHVTTDYADRVRDLIKADIDEITEAYNTQYDGNLAVKWYEEGSNKLEFIVYDYDSIDIIPEIADEIFDVYEPYLPNKVDLTDKFYYVTQFHLDIRIPEDDTDKKGGCLLFSCTQILNRKNKSIRVTSDDLIDIKYFVHILDENGEIMDINVPDDEAFEKPQYGTLYYDEQYIDTDDIKEDLIIYSPSRDEYYVNIVSINTRVSGDDCFKDILIEIYGNSCGYVGNRHDKKYDGKVFNDWIKYTIDGDDFFYGYYYEDREVIFALYKNGQLITEKTYDVNEKIFPYRTAGYCMDIDTFATMLNLDASVDNDKGHIYLY